MSSNISISSFWHAVRRLRSKPLWDAVAVAKIRNFQTSDSATSRGCPTTDGNVHRVVRACKADTEKYFVDRGVSALPFFKELFTPIECRDDALRDIPFTRPTLIAANEFLADALKTHTQVNKIVLRLGLEDEVSPGNSLGIEKKVDLLGRLVLSRGTDIVDTIDGKVTLVEAFVRQAVEYASERSQEWLQIAFIRGLARDGYVIIWGVDRKPHSLRIALPDEVDLPAADDEVRLLLKHFGFATSLSHLDQAVEAHTRGDWAAANAQIRTFLEGLLDEIASSIDSAKAQSLGSSENRRAMLASADVGFLGTQRNEWSPDGKSYIHGLFRMLHTDGSHPGLSTEDHCTFRLHIALITARMLLRRLRQGKT